MFLGIVSQFFSIRWVKEGRGKLHNNIVVKELIVVLHKIKHHVACPEPYMHYSYKCRSFPFEFNEPLANNSDRLDSVLVRLINELTVNTKLCSIIKREILI